MWTEAACESCATLITLITSLFTRLVGSSTGAVARRLILGLCPGFPPSCPFRTCRDPVSSARHIARSVRISRTTRL